MLETKDGNKLFIEVKSPASSPEHAYAKIASFPLEDNEKFYFVVHAEDEFNLLKKNPPRSLRGNIYVMLVNLETDEIIKEEQLSTY